MLILMRNCISVLIPLIIATISTSAAPVPLKLQKHIKELRKTVPKGFSVVAQPPFAVIGDEPLQTVQSRATHTVKWAVDHLKRDYFPKDPAAIIDIWLFKNKASYRKHVPELFGHTPTTPYGYYSAQNNALIMNIATGGGTLVHEIVHPFMSANFPNCPPWFNEGLGSLYEQCGDKNGRIHGKTNWRLRGLQDAIKNKRTIPFTDLLAKNDNQFYHHDQGTHYSQSRYLLYYLQEKGKLRPYYRAFTANAKKDPTGLQTLKKTLNTSDLNSFQTKWEKWVLTLRFP